jgi:hypothetical protein
MVRGWVWVTGAACLGSAWHDATQGLHGMMQLKVLPSPLITHACDCHYVLAGYFSETLVAISELS